MPLRRERVESVLKRVLSRQVRMRRARLFEFRFNIESYLTALDPTGWGGELVKRAGELDRGIGWDTAF